MTGTNRDVTVTAIIPTFNRAAYLGECLDAILAQTSPPDEVIVVDDGSTDDTQRVLDGYKGRVIVRRQENAGKSVALNHALDIATSDMIWIFDDDDVADPGALTALVHALDADPGAGFAFGRYRNFRIGEDGQPNYFTPVWPDFDADDLMFSLLLKCFIFQPAMLVRRSAYDRVGPFNTEFPRAQDYEMMLRLASSFKGTFVDAFMFNQRQHLGVRGPSALQIPGSEIWQRQRRFDRMVFDGVIATQPPEVFLPWHLRDHPASARRDALARLRYVSFLLNKQYWDKAKIQASELADIVNCNSDLVTPADVIRLSSSAGDNLHLAVNRERVVPVLDAFGRIRSSSLRTALLSVILARSALPAAKLLLRGKMSGLSYFQELSRRRVTVATARRELPRLISQLASRVRRGL